MPIHIYAETENDIHPLIFPAEHTAPANNTGDVRLSLLKDSGNTMITHFLFSPGSRNYWHYHSGIVQTLLVLDGKGWYQEEGSPKRRIKKGDVFQFMRQGYFCVDKKSNCDNIVFNRTVALNSSWGK